MDLIYRFHFWKLGGMDHIYLYFNLLQMKRILQLMVS